MIIQIVLIQILILIGIYEEPAVTPKETQISTFSTKILDDSPGRVTNIRITCGILNETVINPGDTFSFNAIVGKPTAERGYQEAKIIINHKTEKGLGGRKLSSK